jgi:hypothetical protein
VARGSQPADHAKAPGITLDPGGLADLFI